MKISKYFIIILALGLSLVINTSGCSLNSSIREYKSADKLIASIEEILKTPRALFLKAWNDINIEYLDTTFNHQDWERWKNRYINVIQTKEDAYVAIDTMLKSLNDPYTRFLPPSDFQEQDMSIESKLYGIGVYIAKRKEDTIIINVIDGTPAKKSGLKVGDIIKKVNHTSTTGLDLKDVVDKVRGRAGSKVKLTIVRNKTILVKYIKREKIDIKSVGSKMLNQNMAYIRILSFLSADTTSEMANALKKTAKAKGIILDLRGNSGGLLPNAIFIADMFINKGTIVSIVDKLGNKETIDSEKTVAYTDKPLVLLIDQSSASASEILSGALKDHKRAVLVGETTYGKGVVQKINRLPDGSGVNITIAKYLTPNGNDINNKGIAPDYRVKYTEKDFFKNKDPQLEKAKQVLAGEIRS